MLKINLQFFGGRGGGGGKGGGGGASGSGGAAMKSAAEKVAPSGTYVSADGTEYEVSYKTTGNLITQTVEGKSFGEILDYGPDTIGRRYSVTDSNGQTMRTNSLNQATKFAFNIPKDEMKIKKKK